jgi:hypothetical protein
VVISSNPDVRAVALASMAGDQGLHKELQPHSICPVINAPAALGVAV